MTLPPHSCLPVASYDLKSVWVSPRRVDGLSIGQGIPVRYRQLYAWTIMPNHALGVRGGGMGKMYLAYLHHPSGNKISALHRMG